jgi:1-deoxy-D-xylulose-5-phosphate synthase
MVATAAAIDDRPSALRYPRGEGIGVELPAEGVPLEIGRGRIIRQGNTVALLSLGTRLEECLKAADSLASRGISTTVADARFAKPLDSELILDLAHNHELLLTVEEGAIGGFGAQVLQLLAEQGALEQAGFKVRSLILPDVFIDHDSPQAMYAKAGLDAAGIVAKIFEVFASKYRAEELKPGEIAVLADRVKRRKLLQAGGKINGSAI